MQKRESEETQTSCSNKKTRPAVVGFEGGGKGPQAKEQEQPSEPRKGKKIYPFRTFGKKLSPPDTLILSH